MIIEIENYKGWEIRFNTDAETFECDIDDSRSVKKSYSAIKNFISAWVKENQTFRQFKIQYKPDSWRESKILTVVGKHGNGNLLTKDKDGKTEQLSTYNHSDYMLYDEKNEPLWAELAELSKEHDVIRAKEKSVRAKFHIVEVKEFAKSL